MLAKLSLRNIQRSFKDYTIYFFTLILGIAVFYMFNSIEDQTIMMQVSSVTQDVIKMMITILSGVSILVSLILGFLIIYATRFLMKRRHKEFAVYMTLGMSKHQISMIILCETILIGLISLIFGLIIGIALSQLMSIFVAGMFEADMTDFEFVFSKAAMLKTILYFAIIYVIVMIFNVFFISKQELITLLTSHCRNENIKMKNIGVCFIVFVIAIGMLVYAYYLVTAGVKTLSDSTVLIPIGLGMIATFMIFYSVSGFALKIFMAKKSTYYKNLNVFTMRQFSSQMNTTVFSMGIICLMLFMTICVLSSSLSFKNAITTQLKENTPVDIYMSKKWDLDIQQSNEQSYNQEEIDYSHLDMNETLEKLHFSINDDLKDVLTFDTYATDDLTMEQTLGSVYQSAHEQSPTLEYDAQEMIVRISDYNEVAKKYGLQTYHLNHDQYMIIGNFKSMTQIRDKALKIKTPILLLGKTYYPKYKSCQDGYVIMKSSGSNSNGGIIIVPDQAVNPTIRSQNIMIANYQAHDKIGKQEIENKILDLDNQNAHIEISSKIALYEKSVGVGTMVTFIAIYLGIIFLISSAAILALKQLSDSADNKQKYQMLRKIGVDERMLNKALLTQIGLFFIAPLVLAMIHSFFGIKFCEYMLQTFVKESLLIPIILTALFIVFVYGGYLLITYYCSKQMIKD